MTCPNSGKRPRRVLFESMAQWIECLVDGLESGIYADRGDEGIDRKDPFRDASLEAVERLEEVRTNAAYPWERPLRLRR